MPKRTDRYVVWGYEDNDPADETILTTRATKKAALRYAFNEPLATAVEDTRTNEYIWRYPQ
jgi:hypothetical protein